MSKHVLVIPVDDSLPQFIHSEQHIDVEALLINDFEAVGAYVSFEIEVEGNAMGRVAWMVSDSSPNTRARTALAALAMVHMVMTGPVAFSVSAENAIRLIEIVNQ